MLFKNLSKRFGKMSLGKRNKKVCWHISTIFINVALILVSLCDARERWVCLRADKLQLCIEERQKIVKEEHEQDQQQVLGDALDNLHLYTQYSDDVTSTWIIVKDFLLSLTYSLLLTYQWSSKNNFGFTYTVVQFRGNNFNFTSVSVLASQLILILFSFSFQIILLTVATYRAPPISSRWSKCGGNDTVMVLLGSGTNIARCPKKLSRSDLTQPDTGEQAVMLRTVSLVFKAKIHYTIFHVASRSSKSVTSLNVNN